MTRVLPPLNALRAFEAAARHESFSRASAELNVSHSAISRHVRGLEDRLGAQLFRDAAPGVALTPEGRAYLHRISPALDAISEATESLSEAPEGEVVVNSDPIFAQQVVAPNLVSFAEAYPDIELHLVASSELADLDRYEADIAIRFAHSGSLARLNDLISDAPLFPYARPGLLPPAPTPAQILEKRLLRDRNSPAIWQKWVDATGYAGDAPVPGRRYLRAPLALEAARGGYGVYLGSAECAARACEAGQLVRLSETGVREGTYRLLLRDGGTRRKAVRLVRTWLLDLTVRFRSGPFWEKDQPIG